MPRNFLIVLILLCLAVALWQHQSCQAAKTHRVSAHHQRLDWIEPPEGMEWLADSETANQQQAAAVEKEEEQKTRRMWKQKQPIGRQPKGRRTAAAVQRRGAKSAAAADRQTDEQPFHMDFGPMAQEGLRRFENSFSILEVDETSEEEAAEKEEQGEPIPWFEEWERMVAAEKQRREQRKLRKLSPATKHRPAAAFPTGNVPTANGHRSSQSAIPAVAAALASAAAASSPRQHQRPSNLRGPCLRPRKQPVQHRSYPRSYEFPGFEASIPREWDWRDVDGVNFCSPNRNQHIPVYCGGCWVFGTLGALNDRFNVARKNRWPMTFLSPQEIIACNGRGSCNGGTADDVFEHAKTVGLVEEGCNNFKAVNEKCTPFTRCGSCWPDNCFAIQNYTRYYIKDFGKVSGRLQMMSEIHNRGPIACTVGCTPTFDLNYTRGIYSEFGEFPPNHIVSVTGWGWDEDTKTEYWIVRNSWGDAWGENGWFRIVTSLFKGQRGDQYNMGIERECYFADPDVSNLDK